MKSLIEALVNKSNIKKIVLNHIFDSYKKKDLKVGDLCLTGDGDVGMVITAQISNEMDIFSLPDYDEDDKIIIFKRFIFCTTVKIQKIAINIFCF